MRRTWTYSGCALMPRFGGNSSRAREVSRPDDKEAEQPRDLIRPGDPQEHFRSDGPDTVASHRLPEHEPGVNALWFAAELARNPGPP